MPLNLTPKGKIFLYILLVSVVFSFLAIVSGFFPSLGLSVSLIALSTLAYSLKEKKTKVVKSFFILNLILAALIAVRINPLIIFLDLGAICYLGSLMITSAKLKYFINTVPVLFAPVNLFLQSFIIPNKYALEFDESVSEEKKRERIYHSLLVGVVTLITLALILPLLSSANPFFKKIVTDIATILGLVNIEIGTVIIIWTIRSIFFAILIFFLPKMATLSNINKIQKKVRNDGLNMLVPKIAVTGVLIIFFITQFELYFSSAQTLSDLGYTYSRYTNEVFAQLSAVAAVIIAVLYIEVGREKINKVMGIVTSVLGIFLTFMAYKSDLEYIVSWGFTYKRLYGFFVATWILGIFTLYLYNLYRQKARHVFLVKTILFTGIMLILVNIVNFDYIIYHFRKPATGDGTDSAYLTLLTSDSLSFREQLHDLTVYSFDNPTDQDVRLASDQGLLSLLYQIEVLQQKYQHLDIRGFNLLEYLQYRQIEDINIKTYQDKYRLPVPIPTDL